jgi:putative SOS response-associated peptidase YedK
MKTTVAVGPHITVMRSSASHEVGPEIAVLPGPLRPVTATPHYFHGEDEAQLLAFAGLYEFWPDPTKASDAEDKWLVTATILNWAAHDALGRIHEWMPLIVPRDLQDQWLDPTMTERDHVQHFVDTIPEPNVVPRFVGKEVGSVRCNGPQLIQAAQ